VTACAPGCTCRRHRERTPEENAEHGARIAAAAERRRHWPTEQLWRAQVHRRCVKCGRLLVPEIDGCPPRHRVPPRPSGGGVSVRLTGADAPWCESRRFG
jgi:hypothetical protein